MKEQILEISEKLKNGEITTDKARHLLFSLFGVSNRNLETTGENNLQLGDYVFSFDYIEPAVDEKIKYLLGNGIDNLSIATLVTGHFNPDFGDFIKDESGKFKYVSYWKHAD